MDKADVAAFRSLKASLTRALQEWMDGNADSDNWVAVGWVGNNAAAIMADAAFAVLAGAADAQATMEANGITL